MAYRCKDASACRHIFADQREIQKEQVSLSRGGVRELAPVITAGHWYRDCDDEASPSNPSPAREAHPLGEKCDSRRRKRLHSPSHKDTLPPEGHCPGAASGTLGGRTCHPP